MKKNSLINKDAVEKFLNSWMHGIVNIGQSYLRGSNYSEIANLFLNKHYAFDESNVLFKPTYTKEVIFRNNKDDALSYFIKGDINEDNGFAIKPWKSIEPLKVHINIEDSFSITMGVLQLFPFNDKNPTKIAFTFVLGEFNNTIKIKAHHSSPIFS